MAKLPPVLCPNCDQTVESAEFVPSARGGAPSATTYESCLRKCDVCGLGFSNADSSDLESLTLVYLNPFSNVPSFVADGYEQALGTSLNKRNRRAKGYKFLSSKSEDHVTWTIFCYLARVGHLASTMSRLGILPEVSEEPALLLWGVPLPSTESATLLRDQIEGVSNSLDEHPNSRSEPDVILDFGKHGLVFIEVKLWSGNDSLDRNSRKWDSYLEGSNAFADCDKAKRSGLYELCRNWRIALDLANNRSVRLINLGPKSLWKGGEASRVQLFRESLRIRPDRSFLTVSWDTFLAGIVDKPEWLKRYISDRKIPE
jgi:hypothetical protein